VSLYTAVVLSPIVAWSEDRPAGVRHHAHPDALRHRSALRSARIRCVASRAALASNTRGAPWLSDVLSAKTHAAVMRTHRARQVAGRVPDPARWQATMYGHVRGLRQRPVAPEYRGRHVAVARAHWHRRAAGRAPELARLTGLGVHTLNRIERGLNQPRWATVRKRAEFLTVDPAVL